MENAMSEQKQVSSVCNGDAHYWNDQVFPLPGTPCACGRRKFPKPPSPYSGVKKSKLTPVQQVVLDYAMRGYRLVQKTGCSIHADKPGEPASGLHLCNRVTIDILVKRGSLKLIADWTWGIA